MRTRRFRYGSMSVIVTALVIAAVMVTACAIFVPIAWFWVVFAIQIMNLSGAAGDLYVTVRFLRLPKDILVKDTGVAMTVYAPCGKGKE